MQTIFLLLQPAARLTGHSHSVDFPIVKMNVKSERFSRGKFALATLASLWLKVLLLPGKKLRQRSMARSARPLTCEINQSPKFMKIYASPAFRFAFGFSVKICIVRHWSPLAENIGPPPRTSSLIYGPALTFCCNTHIKSQWQPQPNLCNIWLLLSFFLGEKRLWPKKEIHMIMPEWEYLFCPYFSQLSR